MFLRFKTRRKNGKPHRYWSVVENKRVGGGRVVQRHVLYLGEINDTQEVALMVSLSNQAALDRGDGSGRGAATSAVAVSRGWLRRAAAGSLDRPAEAVAGAAVPAAA